MDIQLLAMDLDGTSLQADHQSFTPRLQQALLDAHAMGVAIVPTTGRQHIFLPPPVRAGGPWENLCVLCNGGEIRHIPTGQLLLGHYITPTLAVEVIRIAHRYGIPVEISALGRLYLTEESRVREETLRHALSFHLDHILPHYGRVVDQLETVAHTPDLPLDKINLVLTDPAVASALCQELDQLPLSHCRSGPFTIEVTHQQSTKGNGLLEVCRRLDIDPAHAMAMGDNGNDVSMLQTAGFSVAMGNAEPYVQAAATAVTLPYDQDGAAIAIEQYILQR